MAWYFVVGLIVILLVLLCLLRVGIRIRAGEKTTVELRIGPFCKALSQKKTGKKPTSANKLGKKPGRQKKKIKPTLREYFDLARTALDALRRTLHRLWHCIRIEPLEVSAVFGGCDPAEIAMKYGYANAMLYPLLGTLRRTVCVRGERVALSMDYEAKKTRTEADVGISLRLGSLLLLTCILLLPILQWYLRLRRTHNAEMRKEKNDEQAGKEKSSQRIDGSDHV